MVQENGNVKLQVVVDNLMQRVGSRVRKAREQKGIARRVLSDISGVSHRYLAQLEAGEGNISIGLLQRVATALDQNIEWMIAENDEANDRHCHILNLYKRANEETRKHVLGLLEAEPQRALRENRICLIGLRGAGKSTLGRAISEAFDVPFLELNHQIEEAAGMPVGEIMGLYGEEGYRRLEADVVQGLIGSTNRVILAVGGGVVGEVKTFEKVISHFHTIWIKADPEEHMERVRAQGDLRPMAGNPQAMAQLRSILTSREAAYARAAATLDTSGQNLEASKEALIDIIENNGYFDLTDE